MAWGDPTAPADPNQSWYDLSGDANAPMRNALLAFGANMLEHAHERGLRGVGSSLMQGYGAYLTAEQKAKMDAMLAAKKKGTLSPITPLPENARDPGLRAAYDLPLGTPVPTQLSSGPGTSPPPGWQYTSPNTGITYTTPGTPPPGGTPPGTTLYREGTSIPTPEALAAGGQPLTPGAAPPLPQSPFGPGPWGTPAPADPNAIPATDPRHPNSALWNPQSAYENAPGAGGQPLPPTPPVSTIPYVPSATRRPWTGPGRGPAGPAAPPVAPPPYVPPANEWSSAAPNNGLLNLASAGGGVPGAPFGGATGSDTQLGGAGEDILSEQQAPLWQRNNNPGNLRYTGQKGAEKGENGFAKFSSLEAGVAATKRQLQRYGSGATTGKPLTTIRQIISTYSPPGENQTEALIKNAAVRMGVMPDETLDMNDPAVMDKLTNAITQQETGRTLADLGVGTSPPQPSDIRSQATQVAGDQSQATMQGGAGQDVLQPGSNVARMGVEGVPEWKLPGLLEQARAGQGGEEGMFDAEGDLTEAAKQPLRLAMAAGGPAGVQQALMGMMGQHPQVFGDDTTGRFAMYPLSGKIKRLTEPKAAKQWQEITDPTYIAQHPLPAGYHWEHDPSTGETKPVGQALEPPGGVKIEMPAGESELEKGEAKQVLAARESATSQRQVVQMMEPSLASLKEDVLAGRNTTTGPFEAATLPLRQLLVEFGGLDPRSVSNEEWMKAQSNYIAMHAKAAGAGSISDFERKMLIEAGLSLGNTTRGNYVVLQGLRNMSERAARYSEAQGEYFRAIDPATNKPRHSLDGFDKWWRTDPNGEAAASRIFYNFSKSGADRAKLRDDPNYFTSLPEGTIYLNSKGKMQIKGRDNAAAE